MLGLRVSQYLLFKGRLGYNLFLLKFLVQGGGESKLEGIRPDASEPLQSEKLNVF